MPDIDNIDDAAVTGIDLTTISCAVGTLDSSHAYRTTHMGREYLVVPIVLMIGDAVVRSMNSTVDEFVPARELMIAPAGWNGRPIVTNHPARGTALANVPATLEAMQFGQIFNAEYSRGALRAEAWLDIARARELGGDAQSVVDRVVANQPVELSIGALSLIVNATGMHNNRHYQRTWRHITPDHVAMLPVGIKGACSNDMGCGVVGTTSTIAASQPETTKGPTHTMTLLDELRALIARVTTTPVSTDEAASVSPAIAPPATTVIVEPVTVAATQPCKCHTTTVTNQESSMPVAASSTATTTAEPSTVATPAPAPAQVAEPVALSAQLAALGEDQLMAIMPASIRSLVDAAKAADATTRATLVAAIGTTVFTAEQLATKPTAELQQLAQLISINAPVDYSGRVIAAAGPAQPELPRPWSQALKAAK